MKEFFFFLRDVCFRGKKSTSFRKNHKTIEEVLGLQEEHLRRSTQLTLKRQSYKRQSHVHAFITLPRRFESAFLINSCY